MAQTAAVEKSGMSAAVDVAMQRFFSPDTLAKQNLHVASIRSVFLGPDPVGYLGCCAALRDMNHADLLGQIKSPTLVISGDRDAATPWTGHGEILAREIPGAKALHLAAAHLSNLERPHSFTPACVPAAAWGAIWSRPELDRRTRRLLALALTASLGRWEEFALHVRAALASELELCDLKEVLLQTAVYAGAPAANTGFQIAAEQIKKID